MKQTTKAPAAEMDGLELKREIMGRNPLLARTALLRDASGRYCEDIVVPGGATTATNPTGKRESGREVLPLVAPERLADYAQRFPGDGVLTVACVRRDDRVCRRAEAVAEAVRGMMLRGDFGKGAGHDVVRVEMAASRHARDAYGIAALPTFLMFYRGALVYRGQLGGAAIKVAREFKPYSLLYVEPVFGDMVWSEKMLRKLRFSWDLCTRGRAEIFLDGLVSTEIVV